MSNRLAHVDPLCFVEVGHERVYLEFLQFLKDSNFSYHNGKVSLDCLHVETQNRIHLQTLEKLILMSGCTRDSRGHINGVYVNPTFDSDNQPRVAYIPFIRRHPKPRVKRPKRHTHTHRCC